MPLLLALMLLASPALAEPAPDFSVPTLDGGRVNLAQLRGRVVYLDFWATWCAPCRYAFPWMQEMHRRYKDAGLTVLAVSLDKKDALVRKFLERFPADFPIGRDPEGEVARAYGLRVLPSSYLIDAAGRLVLRHEGFRLRDREDLETRLRALLEAGD